MKEGYLKIKLGKRNAILLSVTILVLLLVSSSFLYLNGLKLYHGPMESISIGATLLESTGPLFVAKEKNFFAENGLNVTIKYYDVGLTAVNDQLSGKVDMALSAEYILVGKALTNQRIQTIGSIAKTDFASIVARKDHGIENILDLQGKKIGVVRGTVMEYYLGQFLELNDMNISDVNLVNITLANSANVLINGDVDAMISFPPYVETAEQQLGSNVIIWPGQSIQFLYGLVTCTNDWITQHPEIVDRFLKAISQTDDYINQHPTESQAIVQKTMNFAQDYMPKVWARNEFSLSLEQSLVTAMENEARWMINSDLTNVTMVPDFTHYIYLNGLITVKPDSVNIIH
jgi:ABC-type nitrate/sulfonate/bicarbonate transport system substrate-binding protein